MFCPRTACAATGSRSGPIEARLIAPEIQSYVADQSSADALRFFSLRRLMMLASLVVSEQRKVFQLWKSEAGNLTTLHPTVATVALKTAGRARQGPRAA